jgi:hypothetical protein
LQSTPFGQEFLFVPAANPPSETFYLLSCLID